MYVYINVIWGVRENSNTFLCTNDTEIHSSSKDLGTAKCCVIEALA